MAKHKRNEIQKQTGIPVEQIKYDPVEIKAHLNSIKKKRAIINNSLTAVTFVLLIAAIVLMILFFLTGNVVHIDESRILGNIKGLFNQNSKIIAVHSKENLLSMCEAVTYTFFALIMPNIMYFGIGMRKLIDKIALNSYPKQSVNQLISSFVANVQFILTGCQHIIKVISDNFSTVSRGFQELLAEIGQKNNK